MYHQISRAALLACAVGVSVSALAQAPAGPVAAQSELIRLRYASFDPSHNEPAMPVQLRGQGSLWIVQFDGTPTQVGRDAISATGARVHGYLPENAYVVRMAEKNVAAVRGVADIRAVSRYHAAYRLDPALIAELEGDGIEETRQYNIVVTDKHLDKPALGLRIQALGGAVVSEQTGSLLFTVALDGDQLVRAAHLDEVLWIDEVTPEEYDMNNARIQGGGNYVESQSGYTGAGVNAHIYEGIEAGHNDFTGSVTNVNSGGAASSHGHCTAGIVFGNGNSNASGRGMAPDCGKFYTNNSSVSTSRWQVCNNLVNIHNVGHTTASWGNTRTFFYTSISAEADDIIFDHDMAWTQSQSNAGNQDSRPQAWAKNIFSIGGVYHSNNSNYLDDSWNGGGSTGPAADGRIKPTLSAYYDGIGCSDRTGSSGYASGSYYSSFGGTSGATPIVAGHNVLAIQMFVDDTGTPGVGPFGNTLRNPGGSAHSNRPHFTTLKALQVASARQWAFTGANANNSRNHVGWGFPNLQTMWDLRQKTFIIDETDVLTQGQTQSWDIAVAPGEAAFRAVLNYSEPAANPAAAITLINNLSLRVTSPNNTVYWGNNALEVGNWSVAGGSEDGINPIECVMVQNPQAGTWTVEILATSIVQDSHVETGALDADYGLVVTGGTGGVSTAATFANYGAGCAGSTCVTTPCAQNNPTGGTPTGLVDPREVCHLVGNSSSIAVQNFQLYTRSTGGTQIVGARIYQGLVGAPLATTTMTVGPSAQFYTASFPTPVNVSGSFWIAVDLTGGNVQVSNLTAGTTGVTFARATVGAGTWSFVPTAQRPSFLVACSQGTVCQVPQLGNSGSPVIGTTYNVTVSDALASTAAILMTGFSDSLYQTTPLPTPLPGAPGCQILAAPDSTQFMSTNGSGAASAPFVVPNDPSYIGLPLFHQWALLDPANSLGIVVSDAGKGQVGT